MNKFDKELVQKIRDNVRIHTLLGIQDTGRRIAIRCPFHANGMERTPSCYIFPDGGYKCFGCGERGNNAIDFVMGLGVGFGEAIETLKSYVAV